MRIKNLFTYKYLWAMEVVTDDGKHYELASGKLGMFQAPVYPFPPRLKQLILSDSWQKYLQQERGANDLDWASFLLHPITPKYSPLPFLAWILFFRWVSYDNATA